MTPQYIAEGVSDLGEDDDLGPGLDSCEGGGAPALGQGPLPGWACGAEGVGQGAGVLQRALQPAHIDLLHAALAYLGGVVGEHGGEGVAAGAGQQGAEGVWNIKIGEKNGRVDGGAASDRLTKFLRSRRGALPRTLTNLDEDAA